MEQRKLLDGGIAQTLTGLTIPIFLTQLVTQLYTTVDSVIVGRYVGEAGLAAVGVNYQIIVFAVSVGIGFLMGITVVIGEYAGAGDMERLRKTMAVSVYLVLATWFMKLIVAVFFARRILVLTDTPAEILDDAVRYLQIVFGFGLFTFGYSMCTYILRALGDAVRPMYFLLGSSVMNVVLDLLFVGKFGMGVPGAAYATVISESCAFLGCLIYMYRRLPELRIRWKDFRETKEVLNYTLRQSIPNSLQICAVALSSIFVQTAVNGYGTATVAGLTAAQKIEQLLTLLAQAEGTALLTFVTQNRGAGRADRVRAGYRWTMAAGAVTAAVSSAVVLALRAPMISLFLSSGSDHDGAMAAGMQYLLFTAPFYVFFAFSQTEGSYLRGMADAASALWVGGMQIVANVLSVVLLEPLVGVIGIWVSVPLGWVLRPRSR